jgi:hypothetical protein
MRPDEVDHKGQLSVTYGVDSSVIPLEHASRNLPVHGLVVRGAPGWTGWTGW